MNKDSESRAVYSRRTRASIINDFMVHHASKMFIGIPEIVWGYKRSSFYFIIQDRFKLKFKMLDKNLRTKNINTQQALNFLNQNEVILDFPDLPQPLTNIFAGYKLNYLQTEHDGIYIVCPNGQKNEWVLKLTSKNITAPEVITISTPTKRKRAKPRKVDDDARTKEK